MSMFTSIPQGANSTTTNPTITSNPWAYRPAISSPLTRSSPPRPSSPLSPLSASRTNNRLPPTQSSPVRGPPTKPHQQQQKWAQQPLSRFAARPVKRVPFARTRLEEQEARRRQFFQGGRQRADEKTWRRRDIEGFSFRQSLLDESLRYRTAANEIVTTDADIEDAAAFAVAASSAQFGFPARQIQPHGSWDEMMAEDAARYEEMALEARLADLEAAGGTDYLMDEDDDFDQALLGLVEAPGMQAYQQNCGADGMDMS